MLSVGEREYRWKGGSKVCKAIILSLHNQTIRGIGGFRGFFSYIALSCFLSLSFLPTRVGNGSWIRLGSVNLDSFFQTWIVKIWSCWILIRSGSTGQISDQSLDLTQDPGLNPQTRFLKNQFVMGFFTSKF